MLVEKYSKNIMTSRHFNSRSIAANNSCVVCNEAMQLNNATLASNLGTEMDWKSTNITK